MVTAHSIPSKYAVKIPGNPSAPKAKAQALADDGHYILAQDHVLAQLMPDAFPTTNDTSIKVPERCMKALTISGFVWSNDTVHNGMHFTLEPARWASAFQDLDAAGISWHPIYGNMDKVFPAAHKRIVDTLKDLPIEKRTLEQVDLIYDSDSPDHAETESWYDWVTPNMLMTQGGSAAVVAQFAGLLVDAVPSSDDG